jgi:hypothetical protein
MVAFDLLYLNGCDLRTLPLIQRKTHLKKLIANTNVQFRITVGRHSSLPADPANPAIVSGTKTLKAYPIAELAWICLTPDKS